MFLQGVEQMDKNEMLEKVERLMSGETTSEVFDKVRPPEEFGDAVELFYNRNENLFQANVIDPYSRKIYSEKKLDNAEEVISFIHSTLK